MPISSKAFVIGLTGAFGSGCSTSAKYLSDYLKFHPIALSAPLKTEFRRRFGDELFNRKKLQEIGDEFRKTHHPGYLAELTVRQLEETGGEPMERIVLDGIRNVGELEYFRERFGRRFFLFALECPKSHRWERLQPIYEALSLSSVDFSDDDVRDKDEEVAYGQQVQLCVDHSDVIVINDDETPLLKLRKKLVGYAKLVMGIEPRYPDPMEILMNLAYSSSHGSKCLKRQVGAILVDAKPGRMGPVVGTGCNENPPPTSPCVEETTYGADPKTGKRGSCYRDILRYESFVKFHEQKRQCPECGTAIAKPSEMPPWQCAHCAAHLEDYFWPERAMSWCTAIHAEVAALFAAGHRTHGTTLYTTTFPCFQCAEKIAQAGVKAIVFTESYPDVKAGYRIELAGIDVKRFEGVRSARFQEIFSKVRPYFEVQGRV